MNILQSDWLIYVLLGVMWIITILLVRRKSDGNSILHKLFATNKDLDTTLDQILKMLTVGGVFAFGFVMVIAFHDDIKENTALLLVVNNVITMITIAIRDMFPGGADKPKNGNSKQTE